MTVRLATPVEQRQSLEMAATMANNRVRFVCIPVLNDDDYDQMVALSLSRPMFSLTALKPKRCSHEQPA